MKNKKVIGKIVWSKNDSTVEGVQLRSIRKFISIVCIISALFLICMFGIFLFIISEDSPNKQSNKIVEPGVLFKDCKILQEDCSNDDDCNLFSFCGNGSYKICKIYDCGESYGIFTQDYEGNTDTGRKAKPNKEIVQAKKDACGESMQLVEQRCSDGKMEVMVKLSPTGECKIGGFALLYEGIGSQPNRFTALKGNNYFIVAESCGKITGIVPQTEEGISIF
ncbi:MAG: hypothetical protein PHX30_05045 [Candidatus Pacebacteria bacterium]|jgi:hypothetical protein|nr:hypothetical protein [Candidatus Paceibacterota bacterium]